MTEKLLQYIWQFQYYNRHGLQTTMGEPLRILFQGKPNSDQGPDFLQARVEVGGTVLAGSVELHVLSSQWDDHGHDGDGNYSNVILHVVYHDDAGGPQHVPVLQLQERVPGILLERYQRLMNGASFIPCSGAAAHIRQLNLLSWKERLVAERLLRKSDMIYGLLRQNGSHWEETAWWLLARNFGMRVNADAFEAVARSFPFTLLARHRQQIHQLEALLLGQAGLLEAPFAEDYPALLQREYRFLKKKYRLSPIRIPLHFLRMRPGNFPTVRLAQLAAVIHGSDRIFAHLLEAGSVEDARSLLAVTANDYWHYHYRFDERSAFRKKVLGKTMVDNVIINTVIPLVFSYGLYHQQDRGRQKAVDWLISLGAEENAVTREFEVLGITCANAFDSQALLELKGQYCDAKRCLSCAIGNGLLKRDQPTDRALL